MSPCRFLDTQNGIRENGEQLIIGDSSMFIDMIISQLREQCLEVRMGLWELLKRKNVDTQIIGKEDMNT